MKTLILPVAGRSSRFPKMRPKWLLTMPDGKLMYEKSVENLPLEFFDRIIVTCLQEHLEKYVSFDKLVESARLNIRDNVEFLILDKPTSSHSETVYRALVDKNVEGYFYLKDCDNTFSAEISAENSIATISLNDIDLVDAKNKSYVEVDDVGVVTNIVEKNVISNEFCCGGYGFKSAGEFIKSYLRIKNIQNGDVGEIYISHIIYDLILQGGLFTVHGASHYHDWGTLREYRHYCNHFLTIFCDVDGVLLENGSKFGIQGWASEPIKENVVALSELQRQGILYLVVTTSRPEGEESYVREKLAELDLIPDRFIGGLPHTKRVLVNDFSSTNPYPTSIAVNLERNSNELKNLLEYLNT